MNENKFFLNSMEEIAGALDVGRKTFYRLVEQGLPVNKVGGKFRGHRGTILNWWKDHLSQNDKNQHKGNN